MTSSPLETDIKEKEANRQQNEKGIFLKRKKKLRISRKQIKKAEKVYKMKKIMMNFTLIVNPKKVGTMFDIPLMGTRSMWCGSEENCDL